MKTGSLAQPFRRTPRVVGSTKKCRTSSSPGGPFEATPGGGCATLITKPNAFANVVESRTTNVPGAALRKSATASSREIVGRYQNFEESRTNLKE